MSRRWLEGAFPDPAARYRCTIFDIGALLIGPELFGAAAGAGEIGALAGGEALAGGLTAGELTDLGITTGLEAGIGGGAAAGPLTLGAEAAGGAAPLTTGGFDAALAGGGAASGIGDLGPFTLLSGDAAPLATAGAPGLAPAAGLTTAPTVGSALPAATSIGGTGALPGAAALPSTVAPEAATTGDLALSGATGEDFGGGGSLGGSSGGSSSGGLTSGFDKAIKSLTGDTLNSKDLGLLTSVGGLGMNLLNRNKAIPGEKQINQAAGSLGATAAAQANQGMQLESFINSGTLPPGLADGLKTATAAAEASIKSGYASRGMSGSSAEAQDIQAAHERAQNAAAQVALQLLQQGSSMVGQAVNTESLAANLYQSIMANALQQDAELGKAIGAFAGALAGSGSSSTPGTITIKAA